MERIIPYVSKDEVRERIKNLLYSKGYSKNEIRENFTFEVNNSFVLIDLLVLKSNKILILCESPSETITLAARLSVLISKLLNPPSRIAIATNWMESEVTDMLNGRKWYRLEIPTKEEVEKMDNPRFELSEGEKEKIKGLILRLYSMKFGRCELFDQ
jgi:hypothetical protein